MSIFGRLEALHELPDQRHLRPSVRRWWWKCSCGKEKSVTLMSLKAGTAKSCGCLRNERTRASCTTHGLSRSRTYNTWCSMLARCEHPKHRFYKAYGGSGVKVCKAWHDFSSFLADMGESPPALTLDRKDGSKGYYKDNCRWATRVEQANNTKANVRVYISSTGTTMTAAEAARHFGLTHSKVLRHIRHYGDLSRIDNDRTPQA